MCNIYPYVLLLANEQVTEDEYGSVVDVANVNREAEGVEARSVDAALAALTMGSSEAEDRHPERCVHPGPSGCFSLTI